MRKIYNIIFLSVLLSTPLYSMHIQEGFLPLKFALGWWGAAMPFLFFGLKEMKKITDRDPEKKMFLALAGAFAFVLSALKLPSITGNSSHPTGVALGTLLFGPKAMIPLGFLVLIFQTLLIAHGGITTLGANTISMAVVGPVVTYLLYRIFRGLNKGTAVFLSAFLGNLASYTFTALQMAWAHPALHGGILESLKKFLFLFSLTQVPLAIIEGILTYLVLKQLKEMEVLKTNEYKII